MLEQHTIVGLDCRRTICACGVSTPDYLEHLADAALALFAPAVTPHLVDVPPDWAEWIQTVVDAYAQHRETPDTWQRHALEQHAITVPVHTRRRLGLALASHGLPNAAIAPLLGLTPRNMWRDLKRAQRAVLAA